jgi:hypothetical protein
VLQTFARQTAAVWQTFAIQTAAVLQTFATQTAAVLQTFEHTFPLSGITWDRTDTARHFTVASFPSNTNLGTVWRF